MGLADYTLPPPPDQRVADPGAFMGIAIEGVSKAFGPKQVLDGTDLLIHKGETLVVIGRSGAGKSVLLKNIVRLLEPEAGHIWIEGVEVTDLDERRLMELRKKFGFLFQGSALFDSMTVCENVGFMLNEHSGWDAARIRARACECLAMVGLENVEDKLPSALSGGQQLLCPLIVGVARQAGIIDPGDLLMSFKKLG